MVKRLLLVCIIIGIYHAWFIPGIITGGDFGYVDAVSYNTIHIFPYAWSSLQHYGLGGSMITFLPGYIDIDIFSHIFLSLHMPWQFAERILYLFPFLILGIISARKLANYLLGNGKWALVSIGIFICNTYILMVTSGGQILIADAYAIAPLVIYLFFKAIDAVIENKSVMYRCVLFGLGVSIQLMLDLRITYITLVIVCLYFIYRLIFEGSKQMLLRSIIYIGLIPSIIILSTHAFWLLPSLLIRQHPFSDLGTDIPSVAAVHFFSFAKFENTLSLLHPHWPENIFGKTYFMRPEFLILPLIAFSSLLFLGNTAYRQKKYILFFILLILIGAFLAKGSQDPAGFTYIWLFNHIPGFLLFRDATKWYLLIALGYSIVVPFTLMKIPRPGATVFSVVTLLALILLIRPALLGQLSGTLQTSQYPQDYAKLEQLLSADPSFSRVLWVPTRQRFGFSSATHPAVLAESLYDTTNTSTLIKRISTSEKSLEDMNIKYVVIPYDSMGEIFVKNYHYNGSLYQQTVSGLRSITFLQETRSFGKVVVFQLPNVKDHIWSNDQNTHIQFNNIDPVTYTISITNIHKGDKIILTESYDPGWKLYSGKQKINSQPFDTTMNSFTSPASGSFTGTIYYEPQSIVNIGTIISFISLIATLIVLFLLRRNYLR